MYGVQPWDMPSIDEDFAGPLRCNDVSAVYAESKRFAEVVAQCAVSESKLPVVTLRPFAFVGPYQSLQLPWAVTDFIRDSMAGGPIRIMGDGSTVRSIMYASDYAFWVLAALACGRPRRTITQPARSRFISARLPALSRNIFRPCLRFSPIGPSGP